MKQRRFVLFDLDGTLIPLSRAEFEAALFPNLDGMFRGVFEDWEETAHMVQKAMFAAMHDHDPAETNQECMIKELRRVAKDRTQAILDAMDRHYRTGYQELAGLLHGPSIARPALDLVERYGGIPVLATNPNNPMSCISARMSWVGLVPEQFALVTTAEDFHFLKPDPRYYLEVLAQLDARPEECLMIGNDTEEDMDGALSAGLDGFLVTDYVMDRKDSVAQYRHGTAREMLDYLEQFLTRRN